MQDVGSHQHKPTKKRAEDSDAIISLNVLTLAPELLLP